MQGKGKIKHKAIMPLPLPLANLGDPSLLLHKDRSNKRQLSYANNKNRYSEEWQIFFYLVVFLNQSS